MSYSQELQAMIGQFAIQYNTNTLSSALITSNDNEVCSTNNTMSLSTEMNTRDDRGILVQYMTGALSTGAITGDDRGFRITLQLWGLISRSDYR